MARSARRLAVLLALALPLAGCTTTQHQAQRERLDSARQRAALEPTRVTAVNPLVTATATAEIQEGGRTAIVVTVANHGRGAVTDLPISVGYRRAGSTVLLNAGTSLRYFAAHLPAIAAGRQLTWVFTTSRRIPRGGRAFARIGQKASAPALLTEMNVRIALDYSTTTDGHWLSVRLANPTSVPQYELQVYAYARHDDRLVAAGDATVAELGAGARARVRLPLVGASSNELHVKAIPTVLQ